MLLGDLAADLGDPFADVQRLQPSLIDGGTDRAQQGVRQLDCTAPADVEAIEQSPADELEVGGGGTAHRAVERAQLLQHLLRLAVRLEQLTPGRILGHRRDQLPQFHRRARGNGRRPRSIPSSSAGGTSVHSRMREQITGREQRRAGEAHVLVDHLGVPVAAARQVLDELVVGERVGVDRLQLAMGPHRPGLTFSSQSRT